MPRGRRIPRRIPSQSPLPRRTEGIRSDPGAFFLNAYAATQALLNAIEKAGSTDYEKVSQALKTEDVETPLGKIRFDAKGDAIGIGFFHLPGEGRGLCRGQVTRVPHYRT